MVFLNQEHRSLGYCKKMGERVLWVDETEEGSDEFESSHGSDDDSTSKKLRLSPDFLHPQAADASCAQSSSGSSPLGLTLTKTPSFLSLLQHSLSKGKQPQHCRPADRPPKPKPDEKLKASNFPATFIQIGSWRIVSRHEGELVAKLYYAKRKLVWEVLDRALKSKIEMQWSDIVAIRAVMPDNEAGILEIELSRPPLFYRESSPQPRKHTLWHQTTDFTGGQAPICRRHLVGFPPGMLDRHYNKLLQCDERLSALSRKPFPSCESPYFDWSTCRNNPRLALSFNAPSGGYCQQAQYPYGTYPATARPPSLEHIPNSTISSGMDMSLGNIGRNSQFADRDHDTNWGYIHQELSQIPSGNQVFHYQNAQLNPGLSNDMIGRPVYSFPESAAANPDYIAAYQYSITDQARSNANPTGDGHYLENANWFAPHQEASSSMDQNVDNSMPPFPGISDNFDFFNL